MSSWSWPAAPLPIRTGLEPWYPSQWSRISSTRSDEPSTRYMMSSGVSPSAVALRTQSRTQVLKAAGSSVKPSWSRACTENDASRIQVYG
jgi:hypothetical protein